MSTQASISLLLLTDRGGQMCESDSELLEEQHLSKKESEKWRQSEKWWVNGDGRRRKVLAWEPQPPHGLLVWLLRLRWLHTTHLNTQIYTQGWLGLLSRNIRHTAFWHHYSWCEFSRTQPRAASQRCTPFTWTHTTACTHHQHRSHLSHTLFFFLSFLFDPQKLSRLE